MTLNHEFIKKRGPFPFHAFTFRATDTKRIIPQHWHQSTELLYCLSGKLNVRIANTPYLLKSGDIIIINPNTVHSTHSPTPNHVLCLQLQYDFLNELTDHRFIHKFLFSLNTVKHPQKLVSISHQLTRLAQHVETKQDDGIRNLADSIEEWSIVLQLISYLIKDHSCAANNKNSEHLSTSLILMNEWTSYINSHFKEKISLHRIAKHFGFSDSYFSRLFVASFGINFHDFLNSVRLNEAVNKLNNPSYKISQIALDCGFTTYRNFYNTFIDTYQVTPSEYRENSIGISN